MIKKCTVKADSLEQAKEIAAQKLGCEVSQLEVEVLKEAKKSLFGKVKEQAEISARYEEKDAETKQEGLEENMAEISEIVEKKVERGIKYLSSLLENLGLDELDKEVIIDGRNVTIKLSGDNVGAAIGRRGETINSLQYLTSLVANKGGGDFVRFLIDCGNFRQKREETLIHLAHKVSERCKREGRRQFLEPMSSYDRRIIHTAVSEIDGVFSKSVGEEPNRKVVILTENPKRYNGGRRYHSDRRDYEKKYDPNYTVEKGVSNKPSTYDFEKEFLKGDGDDSKLYGKINMD